jgi:hypothetical protein
MGGGLLQLVAYGAQDAYLSGNPQITFWKGLFKRHTNFSMEPFRINFTGQPNWGTKQSAIVGRHADLLYSTYVEVQLPSIKPDGTNAVWNNEQQRLGYNLIKYAELDVGGQIIERQYGEWMFLWDCLTSDSYKSNKLTKMVGMTNLDGSIISSGARSYPDTVGCSGANGRPSLPNTLYIPLFFFFTRNPGMALPLIALQYHEVKINILWNDPKFIAGNFNSASSLPQASSAALYIDYIYLDTEERRRMSQQSHEYLIEQTQYNEDKGISAASNRIDLTFNHPVKELVWVVQPNAYTNCKATGAGSRLQPFTYDQPAVYEQWLQFNGQDRLDRRYGDYFNKVQPYQHHTGSFDKEVVSVTSNILYETAPGVTGTLDIYDKVNSPQPGAYMYSFALKPEEHQPSGTCNFSRIDTATIVMTLDGSQTVNQDTDATWDVRVYAVNYNILRVMSGMGGLAYSN